MDKGVTSLIYKDQLADSLKSSLKQLEALKQKQESFRQLTSLFEQDDPESSNITEQLSSKKQTLESEILKLQASVVRLERSVRDEKALSHLKYVNPGNADIFLNNLGTKVLNAVSGQKMPLQLSSEDELSKTRIELKLKQESCIRITNQIEALQDPSKADFLRKKIHVFLEIEKQYKDFSTNPALKWAFDKVMGELKRRPNLESFPEVVYTDPVPKARFQTLDVQVSFQDVEDDLQGRIQRRGSLEEVERDLEDLNLKKLYSFQTRQENQEIKILGFLPSVESLVTSSLDPSGPLSLDPVDSSSIPPKFSHIVCIDLEKGSIFSEPLLVGDSFLYRQDISSDFDFLASFIEKTVSISPDDSWFVYLIKCFQVACVNNVSQAKEASFQNLKQLWLPCKDNSYFSKFQDYFSQNSLV